MNGALDGDCPFQIGSYGQWCVVRDVACFGTAGTIRSDKTCQCELCFTILKNSKKLYKIKEQIQRRGFNFRTAMEIVNHVELTTTYYGFMCSFIRTEPKWFNPHGMDLKHHVKLQMEHYKSIQNSPAKDQICKFSGGNIPSDDNFIQQFAVLYKSNEHGIQDSLVTLLLKALVTKMAGKKNARYDDKV